LRHAQQLAVLAVELGDQVGDWAVDKDRQRSRYLTSLFQSLQHQHQHQHQQQQQQQQQQRLRSPYRKRRAQQLVAAVDGLTDDARELARCGLAGLQRMAAVAVCRFDQQHIGRRQRLRQ